MPTFISIDGDDTGHKMAIGYLENDEYRLTEIIDELTRALSEIRTYLVSQGFVVIFCEADGILCKGEVIDAQAFANYIKSIRGSTYTFSAGIGYSLRDCFIALKFAKSSGKDRVAIAKKDLNFTTILGDNSFQ